jgi:hypothetical protein
MHHFRRFLFRCSAACLILAALGLCLPPAAARSQAVASTLRIIKIDSSGFPEVKVQILVLGAGGLEASAPT